MTYTPSIGDGAQLMDIMQLQATLAGYHLIDPDGVDVDPGSGDLEIDVTFDTDARLGGPAQSVSDETGLELPDPDPEDPRKVLVYLNSDGDMQTLAGIPTDPDPGGSENEQTINPQVPIPNEEFCPLAEVYLEADAEDVSSGQISSLRVPLRIGPRSRIAADFTVMPKLVEALFMDPEESEAVMDVVSDSVEAMEVVSGTEDTMETVADSETAMNAVIDSDAAVGVVSDSVTAMSVVSDSQIAMDLVSESETVMNEFSNSQTAIGEITTSTTAMEVVSDSGIAMAEIATSQTAMDAVISSDDIALPTTVEAETAMNEISLSGLALDSIWNSDVAWDMVSDLEMAVGKFIAGRTGLDGSNYDDIGDMAGSSTAMDEVAGSVDAMDAVADSEIAMDSIWESDPGWTTISDLEMAVGKFIAGRAGLDGSDFDDIEEIVSSETVMDVVVESIDAIQALAASNIALTSAIASIESSDAIWSSEMAAEEVWRSAEPELPWWTNSWNTYLISSNEVGGLPQEWADGYTNTPPPEDIRSEKALVMECTGESNGDDNDLTFTLDFDEISTFNVYTSAYVNTWGPSNSTMHIKIDGAKLWESEGMTDGGDHDWTERSLDVSHLSGELDVSLGAQDSNTDEWVALFDEVSAE